MFNISASTLILVTLVYLLSIIYLKIPNNDLLIKIFILSKRKLLLTESNLISEYFSDI